MGAPDSNPGDRNPGDRRRLDDPIFVRKLLRFFYLTCAVLFVLDVLELLGVFHKHGEYEIEHVFGFYSVYGFLGCTAIVLVARAMRPLLMRSEDYYDR